MGHVGSISLWVLVWKAHLVNTWFLAGPSRCLTCDFSPPKKSWAHMGPYVLVLVGSGWEGPSGIHLVLIWATWTPYTCGFLVGRPIWYTSVLLAGPSRCSTCDFHYQKPTLDPHGAHMCLYLWVLGGKAHLVNI